MRSATALGMFLLASIHVAAQAPEVIEGPLTQDNTNAVQLDILYTLGELRHTNGSLPHVADPIFGDDFFAVGADCVNANSVPVWHWHRFDIDAFIGCGHGAVVIADQGGGPMPPAAVQTDFQFGEQVSTFVVPHVLEAQGRITNTPLTFDTTLALSNASGQAIDTITTSGSIKGRIWFFDESGELHVPSQTGPLYESNGHLLGDRSQYGLPPFDYGPVGSDQGGTHVGGTPKGPIFVSNGHLIGDRSHVGLPPFDYGPIGPEPGSTRLNDSPGGPLFVSNGHLLGDRSQYGLPPFDYGEHRGGGFQSTTPGGAPTVTAPDERLFVSRFFQTFEKTFLDADASVGVRAPFLPSMAVQPGTGRVVFSYSQFTQDGIAQDFIVSLDGGVSWISAGGTSDPTSIQVHSDVAFDLEGRILSASANLNARDREITGIFLQAITEIHDPATAEGAGGPHQAFQPSVAVDPTTGQIGVTWMDARHGGSTIRFARNEVQRWGDYSSLDVGLGGSSVDPGLSYDQEGKAYTTFSNNSSGDYEPYVCTRDQTGRWSILPGTGPNGAVADTPGQSRDPHVQFDGQGRVYVVWTELGGRNGGNRILGQSYDGSTWTPFDPFSNGPSEYPGGLIPSDTQDFYRFQLPSGGIRFFGIGPDCNFNGSLTILSPSVGATRWGDYTVAGGFGPDGCISQATTEPGPDGGITPVEAAIESLAMAVTQTGATEVQLAFSRVLHNMANDPQGGTLDERATRAVGDYLDFRNAPGFRELYDGLMRLEASDAHSPNPNQASQARERLQALDAIGRAAGWPTSTQLK